VLLHLFTVHCVVPGGVESRWRASM